MTYLFMDLNKYTKKQLISKVKSQQGVIHLQDSLLKDNKILVNSLLKFGKYLIWKLKNMNEIGLVMYFVGVILGISLGLFIGGAF